MSAQEPSDVKHRPRTEPDLGWRRWYDYADKLQFWRQFESYTCKESCCRDLFRTDDNSSHTLEAHLEACRKLRSRHQNNRSGDEFCDARDLNDPNRDPSEPFFKSKAVDESWIVQWAVRLRIVILLLALGCITYVLISLALYWFSPPSPRPLPSQSPQPSAGSPKDSTTEDGGCDWDCFKFLWQ